MTPLGMCGHVEDNVYIKSQDSAKEQERFMRMGKVKEEMVGRQVYTRPQGFYPFYNKARVQINTY